ncbi:unnamed protein product [Plasmodium vivax]|uniref:(malaria parasite P. vivax) hypothetical protein n=1 Tax=Plasmodium vivax TaxID=5855 RepID=A0A8S4H919_PLAVI|nr:unnamed protein product [Plasmodium vivax]
MNPGNLHTKKIPLKVFYDNRSLIRKLPSEKRNFEIIKSIEFIKILNYVLEEKENSINSWVSQYGNKLKKLVLGKKDKDDFSVYCKNINYLIDIIMQRIRMFKEIKKIKWIDNIHQISKKVLKDNSLSKCERNLDNIDNRYVYVKKMMYDLCEDIDYIMNNEAILNHDNCSIFIKRIEYRKDTLMKIYNSFNYGIKFLFDNQCTISSIKDKFEKLKCKPKDEQTETIPNNENTILNPTETDVQGQREDGMSRDVASPTDEENLEALSVELDLNEDSHTEPKLDTTYAAASLAGISLFGTILYKYGPFRSRFNSRRGAINGSNIFPLDNNIYDANIMNNFEYLQTGIPNDEYQVGYGSVTDY